MAGHDYQGLHERAEEFVRAEGGAVPEELLIAHVFGNGGNAALWRPLLRQILDAHERLSLRADGCWALPNARLDRDAIPGDFVVLDLETTGLKPAQQRVVEVGLVCFADGAQIESFGSLVNPERRLPSYIARLTRIDDSQLIGAPRFVQLADEILARLEGKLLVGFNLSFDIGFLNAELKRMGRPALINERLDLLPLAARLLPAGRRPGLDGVCRALGIEVRERHRALADAELTALAFGKLLALAREQGMGSLESLQRAAAGEVPVPRRRGDVGRGRAVLAHDHLEGIPHTPGVYVMRDARDRVIYVGKAKDLRNRVASYYSQPLGYTRKMDGLLESIARIETVETGSELMALLVESQLIRRYQPQYNRQLRNSESYPYIKIDISNPWPRVALTRQRANDGAVYLGPFRVASAAKTTVDLIHDVFPLRSCTRSFRTARSYGSPCLELALGRCPGPCVGSADREEYRATVHRVVAFLHGAQDEAIERLHQELAHAADTLDFEKAARLRDRMRRVQQLVLSQQVLDEAAAQGTVLIVTPSPAAGSRELLLVYQGRLWAQLRLCRADSDDEAAGRLARSWRRAENAVATVDHDSLDEVHILTRWLRKHAGHPALIPLRAPVAWPQVVVSVRRLSDADLLASEEPGADISEGQRFAEPSTLC
ncbi:MAG TPA: exonuclease domain-containing protein [Thermomicrobiaceae bacterium]|nr:exonuclease domain-containing protein [Thermomicrobiaceae bacterium]